MPGKFVVSHEPGKGYHFNLQAANGEMIATSEHYGSRDAVDQGIAAVKAVAADAVVENAAE